MVALAEIVFGNNSDPLSGAAEGGVFGFAASIISGSLDLILLIWSSLMLFVLNHSFTSNALESMSLRNGHKSELKAILTRNIFLSAPDIILTSLAFQSNSNPEELNLMLRSILQGGWICLLLIPGLVATKNVAAFPAPIMLRDVLALSVSVSAWVLLLPSVGINPWSCLILSLIYAAYIISTWATIWVTQERRDLQRESRLLHRLNLITRNIESDAGDEILPIQLVGPSEMPTVVVTLDNLKYRVPPDTLHERSFIERMLSLICVRAVPGTSSERLYMLSLMNAFVVEIALGVSIIMLSERLFSRIASSRIIQRFGPTLLAIFLKAPHLIPALSGVRDHQLVLDSWGSHIVGLTIGSSIPWLLGLTMISGKTVNFVVPMTDICCSAVAICVLNIMMAVSVFKTGQASVFGMGRTEGMVLLVTAAFISIASFLDT